jgi:selenocysteine-specific elongation factor
MHVVATAGHVDHGKSTLVRALTGIDPDRYDEEKRRGLTIDLGFAWTTLPGGDLLAFVDVPGHERFVTTMLAGVGPVPAAVMVVAADEGWQPQSEEHLLALDALGVRHGLLVVTKSDLADPGPALSAARDRLATTTLREVPAIAVSAVADPGLVDLREALADLTRRLPEPTVDGDVRLWVDRTFTIRGAGTVVTGTLGAGTLRVGDSVTPRPGAAPVTVRGMQSANQPVDVATPIARVAVNLRGVPTSALSRGMALTTGDWPETAGVDVVLAGTASGTASSPAERAVPSELMVHVGSAAVAARVRPLDGSVLRLRLASPLPLRVGDRLLLRDPGSRRLLAADTVDVAPVPLLRRGDARRVATALRTPTGPDTAVDIAVDLRQAMPDAQLRRSGYRDVPVRARRVGQWWVAPAAADRWQEAIRVMVAQAPPLSGGIGLAELRARLDAPSPDVVAALAVDAGLQVHAGRVGPAGAERPDLPGLDALVARLAVDPFDAPDGGELDLPPAELAHGVRSGALLHLGHGVYVSPAAPDLAVTALSGLGEFTAGQARDALGTTRRVVIPLLEHLDASRRTRRLDGSRRVVVEPEP